MWKMKISKFFFIFILYRKYFFDELLYRLTFYCREHTVFFSLNIKYKILLRLKIKKKKI